LLGTINAEKAKKETPAVIKPAVMLSVKPAAVKHENPARCIAVRTITPRTACTWVALAAFSFWRSWRVLRNALKALTIGASMVVISLLLTIVVPLLRIGEAHLTFEVKE
jgi:hypothetical protein